MSISMRELLGTLTIDDVPIEHQHNLEELKKRLNVIRQAWAKPMIVTSGYRLMSDHLRIYNSINSRRKREGKPELRIPMSSRHLLGKAQDISDPNRELQKWCLANEELLEQVGLWCEHFDHTPTWVHFQIVPPKSGNRFFKP